MYSHEYDNTVVSGAASFLWALKPFWAKFARRPDPWQRWILGGSLSVHNAAGTGRLQTGIQLAAHAC